MINMMATELEADTAYISKMESYQKPVRRQHHKKQSVLLGTAKDELFNLRLAYKVYDVVKGEEVAIRAMHVAENYVQKTR